MQWKNNTTHFGVIIVTFHGLVAITVFNLFGLGLWMTGLNYYDSWYKQGPWLHKSIGILLFIVIIFHLCWQMLTPPPTALPGHKSWETKLAHMTHLLLYVLILAIMVSGYLISTADNRAIEVFDWFTVPATITSLPNQEDIAGWIHLLASILIGLATLHAAAALKHHFGDRDRTLKRIFGK